MKHENISLTLKKETWENIFLSLRKSEINSSGNFWAGIQCLEHQFLEKNKK